MAWLTGWDKRIKATIDQNDIDSTLTWFPVHLHLGTVVGRNSDDVSCIFDEVGTNYHKIAVTKADGETQLYVEVVKWDMGTEEAELWISRTGWEISSSADTDIYVYYDNDHADNTDYIGERVHHNVWDSDYVAVYHPYADYTGASNGEYGIAISGLSATTTVESESTIVKVGSKSLKLYTAAGDQGAGLYFLSGFHFKLLAAGNSVTIRTWMRTSVIGTIGCGSAYPIVGAVSGIGNIHALGFHGDGERTTPYFKYSHNGVNTAIFPNGALANPNDASERRDFYHVNTWYEFEITFDLTNSKQYTRVREDGESIWRDLGDIDLKALDGTLITSAHTISAIYPASSSDIPVCTGYLDDYYIYAFTPGGGNWDKGAELLANGFETGLNGSAVLFLTGASKTNGKIGKAYTFDGIDDYGTLWWNFIDYSNKTIEAFVRHHQIQANNLGMVSKRGVLDTSLPLQFGTIGGGNNFRSIIGYTDDSGFCYSDTTGLVINTWYHIASTVDETNDRTRIYVNGAQADSDNFVSGKIADTNSFAYLIGCTANGNVPIGAGYYFDGDIDELRISKIVRSDAWLKATYETGIDNLLDWGSEETAGVTHYGAATLSGVGSLAGIGRVTAIGKATLAGAGTLAAIGQRIVNGAATLSGVGTLAAIGTVGGVLYGTATLSGIGSLSGIARLICVGSATLSGTGLLTAREYEIIDVGDSPINRDTTAGYDFTIVNRENPINANGTITSVEIWSATNLSGCKVGIFQNLGTDFAPVLKCRSAATLGTVTSGSKQTFSGLSLQANAGDYIGAFWSAGNIEATYPGATGTWYLANDHCIVNDQEDYSVAAGQTISLFATGFIYRYGKATLSGSGTLSAIGTVFSIPTAITQPESNVGLTTARINGKISDDGGESCEARFRYRVKPVLYEDYNTGDDSGIAIAAETWYAQTFTPSISHRITSVKLKLSRTGSPGTVPVSIRATDVNGKPTGADLCSGTTDGNTLPTGSPYEWREIHFDTGYNLVASTKYAIVVRVPSGSAGNYIAWRLVVYGEYTGGNLPFSYDWGATWSVDYLKDAMFEEWGGVEQEVVWTETSWQNTLVTDSEYYEDLTGLDAGTEYEYQTQARNSLGEGDWSSSETFTTAAILEGAATLSGVGTLAASAQVIYKGAATLSGVGTLAGLGRLIASGKATLEGTGSLTAREYEIIDVGDSPINRDTTAGYDFTIVNRENPINANGTITSVEIWSATNLSGCKVGIFQNLGTDYAPVLKCRSAATIGTVTGGSKQTFSGLSLDANAGDYIGAFWSAGNIEATYPGATGTWYLANDHCIVNDQESYSSAAGQTISLFATGFIYRYGKATLSGSGTLSASAKLILVGKATLSGTGSLTGIGTIVGEVFGSATLSGTGMLAVAAVLILIGKATLIGIGTLAAAAQVISILLNRLYTLEIRNGDGDLLAILENAHGIAYAQMINSPHSLMFSLPADDSKVSNILLANEIWLRDNQADVITKKFRLQRKVDSRA